MKKYFAFILAGALAVFLLGFGVGINTRFEETKDTQETGETKGVQDERILSDKPQETPIVQEQTSIRSGESFPTSTSISFETATVTKVIDGDTVQLNTGKTLRYIGINTPETKDPRRGVECFGKEASDKNKELVEGKVIQMEKDVSETDKYGRLLRYIYINGQFINRILVEEGFAYASAYPPDIKHQKILQNAQKGAQTNKKGLWNVCEKTESSIQSVQGSSTQPSSIIGGDKDCRDFKTQKTAQDFFIAQGGPVQDPHKLDQDHDGVVCESLP